MNHYEFRNEITKTFLDGIMDVFKNALLADKIDEEAIADRTARVMMILEMALEEYTENYVASIISERTQPTEESKVVH